MKRIAVAMVALLALTASACSSSSKSSSSSTTTAAPSPLANKPVYEGRGPYPVGFTTMQLATDDREVAVFYPSDPVSVTGESKAQYDQTHPLPESMKGIVPKEFNTVVTMDAYPNVLGSTKGPFPVILFSHGAGGYDLVYSGLLSGLASWGFVVVSTDYFEYGLAAQVTGKKYPRDASRGKSVMLASLDLVTQENTRAGSAMKGIVDSKRVAAVGHSAGGNTAFNALNDPRVQVAVGWAPVAPSGPPANKPTMIIGAGGDSALTPATLTKTYDSFPPPKRFVEIGGTDIGHNTFTDVCNVIRSGGGLVQFARQNHLVSEQLLALASNGCAKTDLAPAKFWPIVQHFTVAEIRNALGIDAQPVGLGDGITTAFPPITITYQHQP